MQCVQLVGDRRGDKVVLGCEVGVEGAVGQPGVRHERGDSGAVDAVPLEPSTGRLNDPLPCLLLVFFRVPHHAFLHLSRAYAGNTALAKVSVPPGPTSRIRTPCSRTSWSSDPE